MKVITRTFKYDSNNLYTFCGLGDLHYGTLNFDNDKFKKFISWAKEKENLYIILMGDLGEFIQYKDKRRFDPKNVVPECLLNLDNIINFQVSKIVEMLTPIKDKIIGSVLGNHEEAIQKNFVDDLYYDILKKLGILKYDLGIGGFVVCKFEHISGGNVKTLSFHAQHVMTTGRKSGGKVNRLGDLMGQYFCDIVLRGHSHDRIAVPFTTHYFTQTGKHQEKKRFGIITGSFLKTRKSETISYADHKDYPTKDRGCVIISYNPNNKDLHVLL